MESVAIIGAGQTRYGDFPNKGVKELFAEAYLEMLQSVDRGIDQQRIGAAFIGSLSSGSGFQLGQLAPLLMGHVGLPRVNAVRIENACGSGGYALFNAACAVASGKVDIAIAGGVEKMRDVSSSKGRYWLGVSGDTEFERLAGSTFAGIYALMAARYMHEYGLKREHLSMVAVKNHRNAVANPKAQFRKEITLEQAKKGVPVAYPFNVWDCSPTTDGAAVVLLCNAKIAREFTDKPVYLKGFGAASDYLAIHDRDSMTRLLATRKAAAEAYKQAGIGPKDIDFAEVHDCFTIAEILAYGDLGFAEEGKAQYLLEEGYTQIDGKLPVNASGGLKAKGHPIGATGCGMACEIFKQLRDEAKEPSRQIKNARYALSHNVGGSGGTAAVFIYQRGDA
ncbi:thiolase domain-containing protein [Desulfallas thermosapovorans]|uniref:Acetyl-CoA C-acetyltransferase/acetyl-CoA acyltransferase n=1 Tax=Desulfallas thermosapovorans DSM 6562 TaxID=1121431 RepID=A0A5S4ZTP5_9FIRM|nr:thiolase domain-containing protein [Desulfallas thermosapovorans]TYO96167.1 acetyl-CoA C-acetyltransferase/acetyl-CoA acyltransferase [Desulfallas thermosapovorans DSM 6562]